jgi:hypothetical protein
VLVKDESSRLGAPSFKVLGPTPSLVAWPRLAVGNRPLRRRARRHLPYCRLAAGLIGVSLGLNFIWAGIAIVLGALVGTLVMAFHSAQGPRLSLPQMIQFMSTTIWEGPVAK